MKRAPEIIDRAPLHKLMERSHGTRIILKGASAAKEISDCEAFYANFGHSFGGHQGNLVWHFATVQQNILLLGQT